MDVTGQAFEDMQEQNMRLLQQLREKDDANFKLMSEVGGFTWNLRGCETTLERFYNFGGWFTRTQQNVVERIFAVVQGFSSF